LTAYRYLDVEESHSMEYKNEEEEEEEDKD
jgi:hypothetical protein